MEWKVKKLIEHLSVMNPNDLVFATIWSSADIEYLLADMASEGVDTKSADVDDLWDEALDLLTYASDNEISHVNDELYYMVQESLKREAA